jgi:hypothetical protein
MNNRSKILTALTAVAIWDAFSVISPANAASRLVGLTDNNSLVLFDPNNAGKTRSIGVSGIDGTLIDIDFRPRDGMLYGITDTNNSNNSNRIYTIDLKTGAATLKSTLNIPFSGGLLSGVDFNPIPDRLRLVDSNDNNFRVDVDTGLVTVDTPLDYAAGDVNFEVEANITAAGYTNSIAPSPRTGPTTLYVIDSNLDALVTQGSVDFDASKPTVGTSPNTGQLFTVGSLGVDFDPTGELEILTGRNGNNTAFAISGSTLLNINLANGAASTRGTVGDGNTNIVGLAGQSVPEPATVGSLIGFGVFAMFGSRRRFAKQ